jgi:hypothetical protein
MSTNYNREYYGQPTIDAQQKMVAYSALLCIHSKRVFCDNWVDTYNQYTREFNKASSRANQEFLLDQRHSFYMACCLILSNLEEKNHIRK